MLSSLVPLVLIGASRAVAVAVSFDSSSYSSSVRFYLAGVAIEWHVYVHSSTLQVVTPDHVRMQVLPVR
jgi:hypothetical protein